MVKTRINPKTNAMQYKVRYLWRDAEGNRKDSETGWFNSKAEAIAMAEKLKVEKTESAKEQRKLKKQSSLDTCFSKWHKELGERANRVTMENTTTDKVAYDRANSLWNNYTPDAIKSLKTTEVDIPHFRQWISFINESDISGRTTRDMRRMVKQFNKYLANNGYYPDADLDIKIDIAIDRVALKPKNAKARKNYVPTVSYINTIMLGYDNLGLDNFVWLYWYTLFTVLFFSGVRVEELIGMQWKNVHLEAANPYLDICNAISEKERPSNVYARVKAGVYHTKNDKSNRLVPILTYYYDLLESYQNRFMIEYQTEDIDEMFVFPNVTSTKDKTGYQKQKNILRELKRISEAMDLEETTSQMFRHGCAEFLITDKEHGGLGYTESEAYDYFGHASADMITQVYANLSKIQRADRTSETFKGIVKHHEGVYSRGVTSADIEVAERVMNPENEEKYKSIKRRVKEEIKGCLQSKQLVYWYSIVELNAVQEIKKEYNEMGIDLESMIQLKLRNTKTTKQNIKDLVEIWSDKEEE